MSRTTPVITNKCSSCFHRHVPHVDNPLSFLPSLSLPLALYGSFVFTIYAIIHLIFQHTEKWTDELTHKMDSWLKVLVRHQADKVSYCLHFLYLVIVHKYGKHSHSFVVCSAAYSAP